MRDKCKMTSNDNVDKINLKKDWRQNLQTYYLKTKFYKGK